MRVISLGSGSNGNAIVIQSDDTLVLIDAGVPVRRLKSSLATYGIGLSDLTAVMVTHEHHDHVCTLPRVVHAHPAVPCFATAGTIRSVRINCSAGWETIRAYDEVKLGALTFTPFPLSHDATEPVGFQVTNSSTRVAIATDLGETNSDLAAACSGAQLVVLESNYDSQMLEYGRYPAYLKRRIRGPRGHLANDAAGEFLQRHISSTTREIWLAHLSADNNRPDLALDAVRHSIKGDTAPTIRVLSRNGDPTVWDASQQAVGNHQLTLPLS